MTPSRLAVLKALSAGGSRASALADVICTLVSEGAQLGELRDPESGGLDSLPIEWLERLARAIELGVFDYPKQTTVRFAVDRILAPPLPAEGE
jgi:hypothetical protein